MECFPPECLVSPSTANCPQLLHLTIVSLPGLLEVEASSDPSDWTINAEPDAVEFLKGLVTPSQFASAPKQLAQLTKVLEHYESRHSSTSVVRASQTNGLATF